MKILATAVVALAALPAAGTAAVLLGEFGSPDGSLIARPSGSELQMGCAHGSIAGPITLGRGGRFDVLGRFERYSPGPQRVEEDAQPQMPAKTRFTGRLRGTNLELTVLGAGQDPLTLTLARGKRHKVVRCY